MTGDKMIKEVEEVNKITLGKKEEMERVSKVDHDWGQEKWRRPTRF
jgi:hypothetical protein